MFGIKLVKMELLSVMIKIGKFQKMIIFPLCKLSVLFARKIRIS